MTSIMIDLETLGTSANAPIIAIGACAFTTEGKFEITDTFYMPCYPDFALETPDVPTLAWWMSQTTKCPLDVNSYPMNTALTFFGGWLSRYPTTLELWANSPSFDLVLLTEHYRKRSWSTGVPFNFRQFRDVRTLKKLVEELGLTAVRPDPQERHHALSDAEAQARWVYNMLEALRTLKKGD